MQPGSSSLIPAGAAQKSVPFPRLSGAQDDKTPEKEYDKDCSHKERKRMYLMKNLFRKGISLLLAVLLSQSILLPACAESASTEWIYTFIPREALEGEGTKVVSELLNALQLRITRQTDGADMQFLLEVLSEGNIAFTVTAQDNDMEEFGLQCSLMGDHVLLCQRNQIPSFLQTLVNSEGRKSGTGQRAGFEGRQHAAQSGLRLCGSAGGNRHRFFPVSAQNAGSVHRL